MSGLSGNPDVDDAADLYEKFRSATKKSRVHVVEDWKDEESEEGTV